MALQDGEWRMRRRQMLRWSGLAGTGILLNGCGLPLFEGSVGRVVQPFNQSLSEWLLRPQQPIPEFAVEDIQPEALIVNSFNGTPVIDFQDFRLSVQGEVNQPLSLSWDEIRALPYTSMVVRHVCVEGWAAIVQWGGVRLRDIISLAQPKLGAQYVYFVSADRYYESWDAASALHPQTLLAYEKNGHPLPMENGAPLRLASPIKLGYKLSKWVMQIIVTKTLLTHQRGYWEDQGYDWFAGI